MFPHMRGIATGMSNALRYVIIADIVGIGSFTFNGSIKPIAFLIGISTSLVVVLTMMLLKQRNTELKMQTSYKSA